MPKVPFWVFIFIAIVYFTAVRVDIMDIDASQYAEISREMMKSGDYLHVFDRGKDYLDKPPFLFWMSATSMKVFGVNNFGYKLPSILFALLGIFSTYKLGKRLYGEVTGRMAALILASCQGMFLMTNDVRCDTILMAWTITAIWLRQEWVATRRLLYLLGGCAAIAFGMMTKGPIALMVPVFCFMSDWILKRQWKNFMQPAYLPGFVIIGVLLIPMSIGLYQQFDLHPEKIIDGAHNTSGLRFFYWSQSFGRITGESPWKNGADISFLLLNMLWSFLPWIFLFVPALIINSIQLVKQKFRLQPGQEWISTGGFLITYLALGSSAYQLPHYIFIAFPLAAIVTAKLLWDMIEEKKYVKFTNFMRAFQVVIMALIIAATLVLITYIFPAHWLYIVLWAAGLGVWLYLALGKKMAGKFFWLSAAGMVIVNIFLTNQVYHELLRYQLGSQVGKYIHSHALPAKDITIYKVQDPLNSINFWAQDTLRGNGKIEEVLTKKYVLTMDSGLNELKQKGVAYELLLRGDAFRVSTLTGTFIYPPTRSEELKPYYFLMLK